MIGSPGDITNSARGMTSHAQSTPRPDAPRERTSARAQPWVLLAFDGCELIVPQRQVRVLEPVLDVIPSSEVEGQVGWLPLRGERCPVYCLTRELAPLHSATPDRRVCIVLQFGPVHFGLLCTRAENVAPDEVRSFPLPQVMHAPYAAAEGLGVYEGRVIVQCSAQSVLRFVGYVNAQSATQDGATNLGEIFAPHL